MHNKFLKISASAILIVILLALSACEKGVEKLNTLDRYTIARHQVNNTFSMGSYFRTGKTLNIIFSDNANKSLLFTQFLLNKDKLTKPFQIDIIDTVPSINPYFGQHAAIFSNDIIYILYPDQQTEERLIMKLVSKKTSSDDWNIDVLSPPGKPLAILTHDKSFYFFWNSKNIYYTALTRNDNAKTSGIYHTEKPFIITGNISIPNEEFGFTASDSLSKSLFFFYLEQNKSQSANKHMKLTFKNLKLPYTNIHTSIIDNNGRFLVCGFYEENSTINLFIFKNIKKNINSTFDTILITLAKNTKQLFAFTVKNNYGDEIINIIFNEINLSDRKKIVHRISLISFIDKSSRKYTLYESNDEIGSFQAIVYNSELFLLINDKNFKLLRFSLKNIKTS